jgi:inorganic pyrophosphatase
MRTLTKLPPRNKDGHVLAVVETPGGSAAKFDYDSDLRVFTLSRALTAGQTFLHDFGFIPGTLAEDGDPIDVTIISDFATASGVVIPCRLIGVVRLTQRSRSGEKKGERERNDRLLAVPVGAQRMDDIKRPDDLSSQLRKEIEQFFLDVTEFTGKDAKIEGTEGPSAAERCLEEAIARAKGKGE